MAICHAPAMPNSAVAEYRPGTLVGVTCNPPDITMPGIGMLALARTVPASTSVAVPARRNSMVKALRPWRSEPVGASNTTSRSPARTVWITLASSAVAPSPVGADAFHISAATTPAIAIAPAPIRRPRRFTPRRSGCGMTSSCKPNRRSRIQKKMTGVTMSTCTSDDAIPPSTGVASGFMTSAPARVLHMMGSRPAMTVETVITFGRSRSSAPSMTASLSADRVSVPPRSRRFRSTASSR